jgi:hypothetical protein
MIKISQIFIVLLISWNAVAFQLTGRIETRDSMTSSSVCSGVQNCSTSGIVIGYGVGVTTIAYSFTSDWGLYSGSLLRQRFVAYTLATGNSSTTPQVGYLDLDVPVAAQWSSKSFAVRLGVDLGIKLSSNYYQLNSSAESDYAIIVPIEFGFDWKFLDRQLLSFGYEAGVTTAAGQNGNNNLATSSIISVGYGYSF